MWQFGSDCLSRGGLETFELRGFEGKARRCGCQDCEERAAFTWSRLALSIMGDLCADRADSPCLIDMIYSFTFALFKPFSEIASPAGRSDCPPLVEFELRG